MRNRTRNERVIELRKKGVGPREIARKLGLTPGVVAGITFRSKLTVPNGAGTHYDKDFRLKVVNDRIAGLTVAKAAEKWGVSERSVVNWTSKLIFGGQ